MALTYLRSSQSRRRFCFILVMLVVLFVPMLVSSQSGNDIVYVYDELGRLVAVIDPNGEAAVYHYDAVGNILSISRYSSATVSVIEFTPNKGSVGTPVTIYGTGFSATAGQNTVTFNGAAATVITATTTRIVTSVPLGATTGPLSVTTPAGNASSAASFIVGESESPTITDFSPTVGTAGTAVTITGTNFDPIFQNNKSKFNRNPSVVTAATTTTITTSVPNFATSGHITVATSMGTAVSTADFFVPPVPYNATDVAATSRMVYGESKTVTLSTANKIALVVFDGIAGERASISVTNSTISTTVFTLFNPLGSVAASTSFNTSGGLLETPVLTVSGTHMILIDPSGTNTGAVTFTLHNSSDVVGAITINGPSVTMTTTVPGQNAAVTFSGSAGQRVSVGITNVTIGPSSCCSTFISIKNPDGSTLHAPIDIGTSGGGTNSVLLPVNGTYTIVLDPKSSSVGSATLTLSEDLSPPITINGPEVALNVTRVGQNAWLTFDGTTGQRVSVGFSGVTIGTSGCCSTRASISKPDGTTLLAPIDVGTTGTGTNTVVLPVNGTYAIQVDPNGVNVGNITVTLSEDISVPITINGPQVTLNLSRVGQNARLTFDGTAGQRVSVGFSGVTIGTSGCCSTRASISKPDGTTLLAPIDVGTTGTGTNTVVLPVNGTYAIHVDPNAANVGNITVTLSEDISLPITINGPQVTVNLSRVGQNARLTFDGTAGQRVSVGLTGVTVGTSNCCGSTVSVFKPDGSSLMNPIDVGTSGTGTNTLILPTTGTYVIFFNPNGASTGNVTVTLSEELADPISIGGASLTLDLSRPGRNARLPFEGTAGQRVSVGFSGVTIGTSDCCSTRVSISKPDGTTLLAPIDVGTTGTGTNTVVLPVNGTYAIHVDPNAANVGNITVTLSEDISVPITINGSQVTLNISRVGQNARLTFDGTAAQQVTVRITSNTINNVVIVLFKPDGTQMTSSQGGASFNLATQTLPATGTYSITVNPPGVLTGSLNVNVTNP